MNLYQTLNQEYREFRMKQSLKESEESVNEEVVTEEVAEAEVEAPSAEELNKDEINTLNERIKELSNRLISIDDALNSAAEDEKESLLKEKTELELEVSKIEDKIKELNDCEGYKECDVKEDEEVPAKEDSIVSKIEVLASIPKEDLVAELETLSDEEKEAVKSNFNAIKEVACDLFPEECAEVPAEEPTEEVEEAGANLSIDAGVDVPDSLVNTVGAALLASEDKEEDKEEIKECEISNFKIVRKAPKSAAFMIEAQTKEGVRYITGKNFDEESKTLDEAEISESKQEATNRFKSLLEVK